MLAVMLFAFAAIKSDRMQLDMAAPAAAASCTGMAGATASTTAAVRHHPQAPASSCLYCDAAAHLPILVAIASVPDPWTAAWMPTVRGVLFEARAPPFLRPRARGPPVFPTA